MINFLISITINLIKLEYFKLAEILTVVVDVAEAWRMASIWDRPDRSSVCVASSSFPHIRLTHPAEENKESVVKACREAHK